MKRILGWACYWLVMHWPWSTQSSVRSWALSWAGWYAHQDRSVCPACSDPDGDPCYPAYGLAPHVHTWDGLTITDTKTLPREKWPDNFQEDPDCPGMGTWWCPLCREGKMP